MITFKTIIIPNNRRKDGTYPVKIRVTFKGISRRIPTSLVCYPTDLSRSLKIKNYEVLQKGEEIIRQMRSAVSDLTPFQLEEMDVDKVVDHIRGKMTGENFRLNFFEFADNYILCKSVPTRRAYITALATFERFLERRTIDVNEITRMMLLDFITFVDNEPKMHYDVKTGQRVESKFAKGSKGASSRHLMKLSHIYQAAKEKYNDEDTGRILIPRSPFSTIQRVFPPSQGQKNLGQELMQRIILAQTDDTSIRISLDAFIVSFGLMGANLADLYLATPFDGDWIYNRQKTASRRADKAEMRVKVPEQLSPFIERLQDMRGAWWLPVLHAFGNTKDLATARANRSLRRWCEMNGVPVFTFYAARHTWASLARKAGVEKATIDECLVHKGEFDMADIYAERNWDLINDANTKVLDLFNFPSRR